jgi:tetratricopeptide (TPR) repeat protein
MSARDGRYSLQHVQSSLGVSRAVVTSLVNAGFVVPTRGARNAPRFSFQDLMLLRTAHELRQAKVAPRQIVEALSRLRAALPEGAPLSGVRITALGSRVIVRDHEGPRDAGSGQFVMDFEAPAASTAVRHLTLTNDRDGERAADPGLSPEKLAQEAFVLADSLERTDAARAEAAYRRAITLHAGHGPALINLSALLNEQGRAADVDALCAAALQSGVDHPLLRFNHALALEDLGQAQAALAAYRKALELDPDFADAHYNAACLLESLSDARGALRHFSAYRRLRGA